MSDMFTGFMTGITLAMVIIIMDRAQKGLISWWAVAFFALIFLIFFVPFVRSAIREHHEISKENKS